MTGGDQNALLSAVKTQRRELTERFEIDAGGRFSGKPSGQVANRSPGDLRTLKQPVSEQMFVVDRLCTGQLRVGRLRVGQLRVAL